MYVGPSYLPLGLILEKHYVIYLMFTEELRIKSTIYTCIVVAKYLTLSSVRLLFH